MNLLEWVLCFVYFVLLVIFSVFLNNLEYFLK